MRRKKHIEELEQTKEIKEIADIIHEGDCPLVVLFYNDSLTIAENLYNAGYRRASDVALEVIREVIGIFMISDTMKHIDTLSKKERWSFDKEKYKKGIAELKKKYEREGEG